MEKAKKLLEEMREELPGFVGAALVDREEGLTVIEERMVADFDVAITAAYAVELMRAQERSLQAVGTEESVEVLGISKSYYFYTTGIDNSPFYMHVVISKEKGTLGLLFAYLKRYKNLIGKAVAEWQAG